MDISVIFDRFAPKAAMLMGFAALLGCAQIPAGSNETSAEAALNGPTFVSLNPCLDGLLVELAGDNQILALSHYSHDPASSSIPVETARKYGVTGGTAEEVLALDPDIVIASTFITPPTRAVFERLGIRVETFGSPATIEESLAQIRKLGSLTGELERTRALEDEIRAVSQRRGDGRDIPTMLWQSGQIVPGEQTLIQQLLKNNGFISAGNDSARSPVAYVTLETVLAKPPELLLVAGASAGQRHPALAEIDQTRVEAFDPGLIYCGGPTIIKTNAALQSLREEMH